MEQAANVSHPQIHRANGDGSGVVPAGSGVLHYGGDTGGNAVRAPNGGAVARHVARLPGQAASEAAALISMIERAAADPGIDIERIERMFAMYERASARNARAAYDAAFAAMQPELPEIDKRGKIIIKEKGTERIIQSTPYALWDDTNRLIKPILAKYGFGISFRIAQTESRLTTTAILAHCDGHREETPFSSPIDSTGSKNNVQGWGSALSYGKRYAGTAILNITTKGEDDDGKAAGQALAEWISDEQVAELQKLIAETKTDITKFLEFCNFESLSDIPAAQFAKARSMLLAKKGKRS